MLTKNYQLNIEKSDGTTENISIEIPLKAGTYDVKYTLGTGNAISAGTIVVNETENTYNLNITLSNDEIKTVQIKTPVALTFANATWEQIDEICHLGESAAEDWFGGFAQRDVLLNNGTTIKLGIAEYTGDEINYSDEVGYNRGRLVVTLQELSVFSYSEDGTSLGDYVNDIFENQFPQDLKNVIKQVRVFYTDGFSTQPHYDLFKLVPCYGKNFPPITNYITDKSYTYQGVRFRYPPSAVYAGDGEALVFDRGNFRNSLTGNLQSRYGYLSSYHVLLNENYAGGETRKISFYFNI